MKAIKTQFPIILTIFMLGALFVLISLGNWQRDRLQWKEALVETIDARIAGDVLSVDTVTEKITSAENGNSAYWPTQVRGTFLHDKESHYFATHQGQSGYFIYTPMQLTDANKFILINRGFVPFDRKDPATRADGQVEGVVSLKGLSRFAPLEKPSSVVPENDPSANIFYWKDRKAMAKMHNLPLETLVPFFVDADDAPNPGGLPVGGVTRIELPNNHAQYMYTWYGIAITLLGVYLAYMIQWFKNRGQKTSNRP